MEEILKKLKSRNLKITPQRTAIYKYIYESELHPTAEMMYNELKKQYTSISIATIYKNLAILKEANLIQELNLNNSSLHYDANTEFHSHLVCVNCASIYDYDICINNIEKEIEKATGFSIENKQIYFYGKCKNCNKL